MSILHLLYVVCVLNQIYSSPVVQIYGLTSLLSAIIGNERDVLKSSTMTVEFCLFFLIVYKLLPFETILSVIYNLHLLCLHDLNEPLVFTDLPL